MLHRFARISRLGTLLALASLTACAAPHEHTTLTETTLRHAARGRFLIGTALMSHQLQNPRLATLIATQFNCITAENEFKPAATEPRPNHFNFAPADKIVAFARSHDMKVIGHTLCWHAQTPRWMYETPDGKPLPRDVALANLKRHIDAVVGHFRGQVKGWDVVNEALSDDDNEFLRDTPARRAIGDDYILQAFRFAHAADPHAELYYNDYNVESPGKLRKTLRLVHELQQSHVPITAVGIQSHFAMAWPGALDDLDHAIAALGKTGVKVMLTEVDVDVLLREYLGADVNATQKLGLNSYPAGLPPRESHEQAEFYAHLFRVALNHPGVVSRITLWGAYDGSSWLNNWPVHGRTNHPLLWDRNFNPKPAFYAVLHVLAPP